MDDINIVFFAIPLLFFFMAIRIPVSISLILVGSIGVILSSGWTPLTVQLKTSAWHLFSSYSFSVIPLFLLMGNFASKAGLNSTIFNLSNAFMGHLRGGLAMSTMGACAGFGAICGSSLATVATMSKISLPELKKNNYSNSFSTATLAAGGTLGILIPPSIILIVYSIITEQNISKMFAAALVPGILALIFYIITIFVYTFFYPSQAPKGDYKPWKERIKYFFEIWKVFFIFFVVIGGIYFGFFTPTEGAAIGSGLTGLMFLFSKNFGFSQLIDVIEETAVTTGMIFLIILGAEFFNSFIALSRFPTELGEIIISTDFSPHLILIIFLLIYIILGCFMDSFAMILLTIPIFFPILVELDFGMSEESFAIWFGILTLVVVEVGLITPPFGLNVLIVNKLAKNTSLYETYVGIIPFLISDLIKIILLFSFPSISLFLVDYLF